MKIRLLYSLVFCLFFSCDKGNVKEIHVFEIYEITLTAQNQYKNPYSEVNCWVDLKGPDFDKRVYGFWDGGQTFKVRIVATNPGEWRWTSGLNIADDNGLNQQSGTFIAREWTEEEKQA